MFNPCKYYKLLLLILIVITTTTVTNGQENNKVLKQKIEENNKLYEVNIDKAFSQIYNLLKEAVKAGDSLSQLVLLDRVCRYYYSKNDIDRLIDSSDNLKTKSIAYKNSNYEAMSHVYMAEAYSVNLLTKKALAELDKAIHILDNNKNPNSKTFYTRSNILISQANIYNDQGKYEEAAKKIKMAVKSYPGLKGSQSYNRFQYVNYSNLGGIYIKFNVDSAAFYATESIKLMPKKQKGDEILALNYYVLGKKHLTLKDTNEALNYFLKANELTEQSGESSNTVDLYQNIIDIYFAKGDSLKTKSFRDKLKEHELFVLKSKYNSLQKVISKKVDDKPVESNTTLVFIISALVLSTLIIVVVLIYKKRQKKQLLQEKDNIISTGEYELLLQMIKKDDSSFIYTFEKIFPDFSKKLLTVCPQLVQTEIEFCALLKMKLSTKQIAQLTFIETRTVQNKKHRIRKKLNIASDIDIYNWFDSM